MTHEYTPTRPDTFSFLVFTFVAATVALTVTKSPSFRRSLSYQYLTSICLALVVFIIPATICLRLALWQGSVGSKSWIKARAILFAEAYLDISAFCLILILACFKFKMGGDSVREAGPADLHWRLNGDSYALARKLNPHILLPDMATNEYLDKRPWLWHLNFYYYVSRFILVYLVFLPISISLNIYITSTIYSAQIITSVTTFNDNIFFISFCIILLFITTWFYFRVHPWQALVHFLLLVHSVLICYFISDSTYLTELLLGSLTIYLSTLYDMVSDNSVEKIYNIPGCLIHQASIWARGKSHNATEDPYFLKATIENRLSDIKTQQKLLRFHLSGPRSQNSAERRKLQKMENDIDLFEKQLKEGPIDTSFANKVMETWWEVVQPLSTSVGPAALGALVLSISYFHLA